MFPKTVGAAYMSLCSSIDTPRSLACMLLYSNDEHLQLVQLETNPLDYDEFDHLKFRDDYLVTEYLKKYPGLNLGIDTEAVALEGFATNEGTCRAANHRIMSYESIVSKNRHLARIITYAQRIIESCIRTEPDFDAMARGSRWGKGSTFSLKGEMARIDAKVCEDQISVTEQALPFVRAALASDFALLRARGVDAEGPTSLVNSEFNIVPGARGTTVPKNAKTDRFIAIEPSGNVFIQLGYGGLLRSCLRRSGIDLNDQVVNRHLASVGERDGLATIDLSAASDTICWELVWLLLPFRWAYALDSARSPKLFVNNQWVYLEKFSSMGNGFTFELETLIFWALTSAVCEAGMHSGRVSVYGDDIICPKSAVRTLIEVMTFCGFKVNTKKSHYQSRFRESCGKHYFGGFDVTPVYQKETLATLEAYYRFHNRWVYHAHDRSSISGAFPTCYRAGNLIRVADTMAFDRTLRDVIIIAGFNRLDAPHLLPLQADEQYRTLDGGLVVDGRRLSAKLRYGLYVCRSWVFQPEKLDAIDSALYAVKLRYDAPLKSVHSKTHFLGLQSRERRPRIQTELIACKYIVIDHELAAASDGTVTLRNRGEWVTKNRAYPQSCNMQWV